MQLRSSPATLRYLSESLFLPSAQLTDLSLALACMAAESCDLDLQNVKNASCSSMILLRAWSRIEGAMYVEAGIRMCFLVPVAVCCGYAVNRDLDRP